jgi:ABC-type uncharacterized transport system auxiliary subunit
LGEKRRYPMLKTFKKPCHTISTTAVWLAVIVVLLFGGCTNIKHAPLDIHYYTLEYDPRPPEKTPPLPQVLKIERFQTSPLYDSNRMIFKDADFRRDEFSYHKWRAQPGELVSYFLARDFSETGRFQATLYFESALPFTYIITGVVEDFYLQAGNPNQAVLSVSVNLVDNTRRNDGRHILMQKKYRRAIAASTGGPQGLAASLSVAMQQISEQILDDVSNELGKN